MLFGPIEGIGLPDLWLVRAVSKFQLVGHSELPAEAVSKLLLMPF